MEKFISLARKVIDWGRVVIWYVRHVFHWLMRLLAGAILALIVYDFFQLAHPIYVKVPIKLPNIFASQKAAKPEDAYRERQEGQRKEWEATAKLRQEKLERERTRYREATCKHIWGGNYCPLCAKQLR